MVAHRLSTIHGADRILLLNEKRLVAMGTHRQPLDGNEYYRSLVASQPTIIPTAGAERAGVGTSIGL